MSTILGKTGKGPLRAILYRTPKFSLFTWIFGVLETVKSGLIIYREWKKLRFFNLQVPTRNRCPLFYPLEKITPIPPSQFSPIFNLVRIFFGVRSKKWRSECFGRPLPGLQKKNWRRFLKQKVKKLNFFLVNNGSYRFYIENERRSNFSRKSNYETII